MLLYCRIIVTHIYYVVMYTVTATYIIIVITSLTITLHRLAVNKPI